MLKRFKNLLYFLCLVHSLVFAQNSATEPAETQEEKQYRETMQSLKWVQGPTTVNVGSNASFKLPEGYVFLEKEDTYKLMQLMHNPGHKSSYYFGPKNMEWFALFTYEDTGHINDDEKIDADALLTSFKQGSEISNKERQKQGWEPLHIIGWLYAPFYDPQTKRLDWALNLESGGHSVVNYNTRILSRTGVTSSTLVAGPEQLSKVVPEFKTALNGYKFNNGEQYAEYRKGDKTAEYGLMALIAGGAAAVATKKGLWAVVGGFLVSFWKIIAAGVAIFYAFISKFFKRNH